MDTLGSGLLLRRVVLSCWLPAVRFRQLPMVFSLSLCLSLSLAASCQLCRSLARRIRAFTSIAIPLSRSARTITGSRANAVTAAARQRRRSTHPRWPCSPFHLDRRSLRRDNIRRRQATLSRPTRSRYDDAVAVAVQMQPSHTPHCPLPAAAAAAAESLPAERRHDARSTPGHSFAHNGRAEVRRFRTFRPVRRFSRFYLGFVRKSNYSSAVPLPLSSLFSISFRRDVAFTLLPSLERLNAT